MAASAAIAAVAAAVESTRRQVPEAVTSLFLLASASADAQYINEDQWVQVRC